MFAVNGKSVSCVVAYPVKQCLLTCDCDTLVDGAGTHAPSQGEVGGSILHVCRGSERTVS